MGAWFESYPELFAEERRGLEALGFELDAAEFDAGRVLFRGSIQRNGHLFRLVVVYPDSFPYLRPEVFAPDLKLRRHQNPFRGNLCLLDRSSRAWEVDLSGAWLISERVPYLLDLLDRGDVEEMRRAEAPQGEPASRYFRSQLGAAVFVPAAMLEVSPDVPGGTMRLSVGQGEEPAPELRACLTKVQARGARRGKRRTEGAVLATADEPLRRRFGRTALQGSWVRLDEWPVADGSPQGLWQAARAAPGYEEPQWQRLRGGHLKVLGIVAREEVRQGKYEDAWLFALRLKRDRDEVPYLVRGERLSVADLAARIPSIAGLQDKTVSLTGLGALGAPVAMEFARSLLGDLRVLDDDDVEAGTIVRWPVGVPAVGHAKVTVIAQGLPAQYPYTKVRGFGHRVGAVPALGEPRGTPETEVLDSLLERCDLLVDATAELGVQYYLATQADERRLPQIYAWMTEGGFGGAVARVAPGQTGCWLCLQWHLQDGTIPTPPRAQTGTVQPGGCAEPTFTGAGFDALPVVAQTVRVAARTLLHGRRDGKDVADVFVCSQPMEDEGTVAAPRWEQFPLTIHPRCERCTVAA